MCRLRSSRCSNIGPNDVNVTGPDGGAWDVEFRGVFANVNVSTLVVGTGSLVGGLTEGAYQAQIRLREVDEFGGSTVRFANIKYAQNGIRVLGQPTHSPLAGEHTEVNDGTNNAQGGAQNLGNLLRSDRGVLSVAGSMSGAGDVDWYEMQIQYGATQGIPGISTDENWWSTIFDIDYADGFARPNTIINIYDAARQSRPQQPRFERRRRPAEPAECGRCERPVARLFRRGRSVHRPGRAAAGHLLRVDLDRQRRCRRFSISSLRPTRPRR